MARKITLNVTDKIYAALEAVAAPWDQSPREYLEQIIVASAMGADISLKLKDVFNAPRPLLPVEQPLPLNMDSEEHEKGVA